MNNRLVIGLVTLIIIVGGVYLLGNHKSTQSVSGVSTTATPTKAQPAKATNKPSGPMSVKGKKLADNKMLAPHAYLVYPVTGALSADAQTATSGWTINSTPNSDGTTTVTFTPDNTEQEDHAQTFTVKPGDKLYYVELNLQDDINGQDELYFDDIGILTDKNGIILNDLPKPPQRGPRPPQGTPPPSMPAGE